MSLMIWLMIESILEIKITNLYDVNNRVMLWAGTIEDRLIILVKLPEVIKVTTTIYFNLLEEVLDH